MNERSSFALVMAAHSGWMTPGMRALIAGFALLGALQGCTHARSVSTGEETPSESSVVTPSASPSVLPVIPWISAPAPNEIPPSAQGVRRCRATDLAGSFLTSGAAAGNVLNVIAVRNESRTRCYVKGRPHLRLIARDGLVSMWSAGTTFFPDEGSVEILLRPHTSAPRVDGSVQQGQAMLGFSYFDCDPRDLFIRIVVEFSGSDFVTEVKSDQLGPSELPACNGSTVRKGPVPTSANNFEPPNRPSPFGNLSITLDAPTPIKAGSRLRYLVTISNAGTQLFRFAACPGYRETLGDRGASATFSYRLNCKGVKLAVEASATFEMVIDVPKQAMGQMTLGWQLLPARHDLPASDTLVLVTN